MCEVLSSFQMSKSICGSQCFLFRANRVQMALWVLNVADPWFRWLSLKPSLKSLVGESHTFTSLQQG